MILVLVASRRLELSDREAATFSYTGDMQGASETARQIVEFEELVSRLDRINDVVRPSATTSTSVPPPPPPSPPHPALPFGAASLPYTCLQDPNYSSAQDSTLAGIDSVREQRQQQQPVRVHIGIDEDLRMILEMDPSIVDRTPAPVLLPNSHSNLTRPLRATRPQGWYWTVRD